MTPSNRPTAHNPGSKEAMKLGCTCSPTVNYWGAGEPIGNIHNKRWTAALGCPLHSSWPDEPNLEG
jgi:hypothetical protein